MGGVQLSNVNCKKTVKKAREPAWGALVGKNGQRAGLAKAPAFQQGSLDGFPP